MEEDLKQAVKIAQSYILLLLEENIRSEQLVKINNLFQNCPVEVAEIPKNQTILPKCTQAAGLAIKDKIIIDARQVRNTNLTLEYEKDELVATIIHEYAHKIRSLNNNYGHNFEEGFANIFAELCINNAKLKNNKKQEPFSSLQTSYDYRKYESEVRALLYILKQHHLDKQMIMEYITGEDLKFKNICEQILGAEFASYFAMVSSRNNENSESLLISLIAEYIKKYGLDIKSYWNGKEGLENNLYVKGSSILAKAVVAAGIGALAPEQQEYYKYFAYSATETTKEEQVDAESYIANIRTTIINKYSLKGKNQAEIYDTILDLCSDYNLYQSQDNKDAQAFIKEMRNMFPQIEDFKQKFIMLRRLGKDIKVFENIDLNNPTYEEIYYNINSLVDSLESNITR